LVKRIGASIAVISAAAVVTAGVVVRLSARQEAGTRRWPAFEQSLSAPSADSALPAKPADAPLTPITIDYPVEKSVFPPEITAPTFLWHDAAPNAAVWRIEVTFASGAAALHEESVGEPPRVGDVDPRCIAETNELPALTPYLAAARSWKPDTPTWAAIKKHSAEGPATVTITGFTATKPDRAVSRGRTAIETSKDPAGAPIFYRDVPLMPSEVEKGLIKPLAADAVKLIGWRLRDLSETRSRLLLEDLPTCANCHSFSSDGKTLGMDVDGPENDKGTYAISPIKPQMSIRNEDVITWNSFRDKPAGQTTIGFMSQLSPDGQYVVSTVNEAVYVANFKDYRFLQVFYPTRGTLCWYSRTTGRMAALPGADDPRYVQTNAVWTPDGKYLIFARAKAADPYPDHRPPAKYANDPNEVPMQYDLYRIPFNGGKGGRVEPVEGASRNDMSNSFPKVSPDGRWIVFVQCRNGLLMRPDSQLYIVPVTGGRARRMRCNTPLMNSWHSFSPNGRWLVFSSKSRSPYTQMFLTHLDEEGNDSPAILIENSTAANRAVNIPEFVNIPADGLLGIDVPAAEFGRLFDRAVELTKKGRNGAAIAEWEKALELSPGDAKAHSNLGVALVREGRLGEAIAHFQRATTAKPGFGQAHFNLGCALAQTGKWHEAIMSLETAVEINGDFAEARNRLGKALTHEGQFDQAIVQFQKALETAPNYDEAHTNLGNALARKGRFDQAIPHWQKVLELNPQHAEAHNNLGVALVRDGSFDQAIVHFQKALSVDPGYVEAHYNLGRALAGKGKFDEAVMHWQRALDLNPDYVDARYYLGVAHYERGEAAEALADWRLALRAEPKHVVILNQTAWVLATCPQASARNGAEAVDLAERAAELSGGRDAGMLDTLGAAYAEAGRFPEAVKTARRALALARQQNNQRQAEALKARIALYEARAPFRDTREAFRSRTSRP
jgi:tetratricopeptide (TPR) repeat protein